MGGEARAVLATATRAASRSMAGRFSTARLTTKAVHDRGRHSHRGRSSDRGVRRQPSLVPRTWRPASPPAALRTNSRINSPAIRFVPDRVARLRTARRPRRRAGGRTDSSVDRGYLRHAVCYRHLPELSSGSSPRPLMPTPSCPEPNADIIRCAPRRRQACRPSVETSLAQRPLSMIEWLKHVRGASG